MKSLCYALLCLAPLIATASNDISKVNSSIHVEAGQSVATQQQQAIVRLAQQIVGTMETPW